MKKRKNLKLFRIDKELSQQQIAEKLGYSRGQYARFENGEQDVTLRFLEALTTAFGISLKEAKAVTKRENE